MMLRVSAFCALVSSLASAFLPPQQLQQYGRTAHFFAEKNDNDLVGNLGKAALQVGADFFVALRWGAANAITAALPEEQRKVLLERMDPEPPKYLISPADPSNKKKSEDDNDEFQDEMVIKNSVNEAVAAAVAVQSQREKKWEKEKEQILAQAEEAVTKRVESDFAIQKQRLEQEQELLKEQAEMVKLTLEIGKKTLKERVEQERRAQEEALKRELEEKEEELREKIEKEMAVAAISDGAPVVDTSGYNKLSVHPILGEALQDLGYKRLHLVSADKLATIPVWKKQRIYRHGVICLHEEENGKLSILDGQHRVGMMKILQERQQEQQQQKNGIKDSVSVSDYIDLDKVLVEVYSQTPQIRSTDHAQDIFAEINKAEPVKLVDMPGVATAKDRNLISQAVNRLEEKFPAMFSPSQRCRAPNVNVDNLRDNLFAANVIKRHNLKTATQLLDFMMLQNKNMSTKYESDENARDALSPKVWSKAAANKFYLGLESSWLYN
jgi:hypothetical protein